MKLFRSKAIVPLIIVLALGDVFLLLFADRIAANIIVSAGESVFRAKVEMASFKTRKRNLSVEIKGLRIADRNDEWKNLVQADKISFGLRFYPLLLGKLVIDEMTVDNIRWGARRESSGALSPKKLRKMEKKKKNKKQTIADKMFSSMKGRVDKEIEFLPASKITGNAEERLNSIDAKKIVAGADLKAPEKIKSINDGFKGKYDKYKSDINGIDIDGDIAVAKKAVSGLGDIRISKQGDIVAARDRISALNEQKKALEGTAVRVKSLKKEISAGLPDVKGISDKIDDIIKEDYKNILSKVKLPEISKKGIAKSLFGRAWLNRVNKVLYYMGLARKYVPPRRKKEKKAVIARDKGMDIIFFKKESFPGLLVKQVNISGTTGGEGKDNLRAFSVAGRAEDISSDQQVHQKPMVINLKGSQGGRKYVIGSVLDHTGEVPVDTLSFEVNNLGIAEFNPLEGSGFPAMKSGNLDVDSRFVLKGDELDCRVSMEVNGIRFSVQEGKEEPGGIIGEALKSIDSLTVTARVYGKTEELKTKIESNIDDIISKKLKAIYGKKVSELKKKIRTELDNKIGGQKEELMASCSARRKELEGTCTAGLSDIQKEKELLDKKVKGLEDGIRQIAGKAKKAARKKAEDKTKEEIKKKIPSGLKKLF